MVSASLVEFFSEEVYTPKNISYMTKVVNRILFSYHAPLDQVEDIVQETFLRAWRGLKVFRGDAKVSSWLYRIAKSVVLESIKRAATSRTVITEKQLRIGVVSSGDTVSLTSHCENRPFCHPHQLLRAREVRERYEKVRRRVPSRQRRAFELFELNGWRQAKIASKMETTPETTKNGVRRARLVLQELMGVPYASF